MPKLREGHASGDLQSLGVELLEVTKIQRKNIEISTSTHLNAKLRHNHSIKERRDQIKV
jgi:hypothetical protein